METILFILVIFLLALAFSKMEIEIEGDMGWAQGLPTWRLSSEHLLSKLLFWGRPVTGYHLWTVIFTTVAFHTPHLFLDTSLVLELRILSGLILFWVLEDFLWFVFNPAFGLSKFRKENIPWHEKSWWLIAPRSYFIFLPISVILYLISLYI